MSNHDRYVSPEGVVLGADSTASFTFGGGHYYNHNQKLFELGDKDTTFGIVTWGLGGLGDKSYRTLFARLAADIKKAPPKSVQDVADRWAVLIWAEYNAWSDLAPSLARARQLDAKPQHDPKNPSAADVRTKPEEDEFRTLIGVYGPMVIQIYSRINGIDGIIALINAGALSLGLNKLEMARRSVLGCRATKHDGRCS